ncbi:9765_t:CDS:1, partial [Gigaspora rosea]
TGTIDSSKYVDSTDEGGQYDTNAPSHALCAGFKKFVNLVEPDNEHFCIRCCNDGVSCDVGRSTDGCESIIPGDYS